MRSIIFIYTRSLVHARRRARYRSRVGRDRSRVRACVRAFYALPYIHIFRIYGVSAQTQTPFSAYQTPLREGISAGWIPARLARSTTSGTVERGRAESYLCDDEAGDVEEASTSSSRINSDFLPFLSRFSSSRRRQQRRQRRREDLLFRPRESCFLRDPSSSPSRLTLPSSASPPFAAHGEQPPMSLHRSLSRSGTRTASAPFSYIYAHSTVLGSRPAYTFSFSSARRKSLESDPNHFRLGDHVVRRKQTGGEPVFREHDAQGWTATATRHTTAHASHSDDMPPARRQRRLASRRPTPAPIQSETPRDDASACERNSEGMTGIASGERVTNARAAADRFKAGSKGGRRNGKIPIYLPNSKRK